MAGSFVLAFILIGITIIVVYVLRNCLFIRGLVWYLGTLIP